MKLATHVTTSLAIVVIPAIIGLGAPNSASASVLCPTNEDPCSGYYEPGLEVLAESTTSISILGGFMVTKCEESALSGETTGNHFGVEGELNNFTFAGCSGFCTKVEMLNLPFKMTITTLGGGDGNLYIGEGEEEAGLPILSIGCPLGLNCMYYPFAPSEMTLWFKGGEPASIEMAQGLALYEGSSFFCGYSIYMEGTYSVITPEPVFASNW